MSSPAKVRAWSKLRHDEKSTRQFVMQMRLLKVDEQAKRVSDTLMHQADKLGSITDSFLTSNDREKMDHPEELKLIASVHREWVHCYERINTAIGVDSSDIRIPLVPSETIARILWSAQTCRHGWHKGRQIPVRWMHDIYVRIVVISCRHTSDAARYWPSAEEWADLKLKIATYTHHHMQFNDSYDLGLGVAGANKAPLVQEQLDDTDPMHQRFVERKQPLSVLNQRARNKEELVRKAIRQMKSRGQDVPNDLAETLKEGDLDASDEAVGDLWASDVSRMVQNVPRLASRLIFKVDFDNAFIKQWTNKEDITNEPPVPSPGAPPDAPHGGRIMFCYLRNTFPLQFTDDTMKRLFVFVITKSKKSMSMDFKGRFRFIQNRMMWPLGANLGHLRDRETKDMIKAPEVVLQEEIGVELAQHYQQIMIGERFDAFSSPDHVFFDGLLIALVELTFSAADEVAYTSQMIHGSKNVTWLGDYMVIFPEEEASQFRLYNATMYGFSESRRCPVMVRAGGRWWLWYRWHLLPCIDLPNCVLAWMYVVVSDLNGQSESRLDFAPSIKRHFIPDWETCLKESAPMQE